jgi:tRNA-specific 2-thiouridylase
MFDVPQWAPTPGQYLVLYDGEICVGGGVIVTTTESTLPTPARTQCVSGSNVVSRC